MSLEVYKGFQNLFCLSMRMGPFYLLASLFSSVFQRLHCKGLCLVWCSPAAVNEIALVHFLAYSIMVYVRFRVGETQQTRDQKLRWELTGPDFIERRADGTSRWRNAIPPHLEAGDGGSGEPG